jgi:acetyltransferase-like isoleucine patch superfamily enzyme
MFLKDIPELSAYKIEDWSYCSEGFKVLAWGEGATLQVGKFCSIADHVSIFLGGEHRTDWVTTYPFNVLVPEGEKFHGHPKTRGDVIIGHDVWIGSGAVIMSGVKIGNGAVIGARSVVAKDVPPYGIVAGNPGKFIRHRFSLEEIEAFQRIAWWDWDISRIKDAFPLLLSNKVREFIQLFDPLQKWE